MYSKILVFYVKIHIEPKKKFTISKLIRYFYFLSLNLFNPF